MDAEELISAMIISLVNNPLMGKSWKAGYFDAVTHAISAARGIDENEAGEWLAEEVQERIADQA